jgi:hypothetical protein
VFKLKRDEAGAIIKHKARLVARGFVQQEGINFDDTFAPIARMESVRLLFALAAQEGWRVYHLDVKSVFLNGDLKEEIYVHQPLGFVIPSNEGKVLRLRKALYGQDNGGNALLVGLYIDDLVITDTKDAKVAAFKEEMNATFQMSDLLKHLGPYLCFGN